MQAQMMPTSALPPPPSNSSQPPTPFQPQSDPSTSPSISNNPPPQPPPTHNSSMPTYASINSSSYQSGPGPSYSQQQHLPNQYIYQQQQHQPQQAYYSPQPPRHTQPQQHNLPYNSTSQQQQHQYSRYQDQPYSHQQPHLQNYQPMYTQHPYANYPGIPINGVGGPGPATMQNGYGGIAAGYQAETYQHIPYGVYPQHQQQHYPIHQESYQQYPSTAQPNGNSEEGDLQQLTHQPPNFPSHDQIPNGHSTHAQIPHQQFHPAYPPNHPYAYGVGVGYPGYQQQPQQPQHVSYGGYPSAYQDNYIPPSSSFGSMRGFGKGLNPAAAGFSYTPSSPSGSRANSQPSSTPVPNGDITSSTFGQSSQSSSAVHPAPAVEPTAPTIPNGETEKKVVNQTSESQVSNGHSINAEKSTSSGPDEGQKATTQSETPTSSSAPPTDPDTSASTTAATASTAATTISSPVSAPTPKAPETELPSAVSPKSTATHSTQPEWTFVGESLAGLKSPPVGTTARKVSGPSATSSNASSSGKKRVTSGPASSAFDQVKLVLNKPSHTEEKSNTYSIDMKSSIPSTVKILETGSEGEKRIRQSKKGKSEASEKKAVFVFGDEKKKASRPRASEDARKLVFGEIDLSELAISAPAVTAQKSETETPSSAPEAKPSTSSSEISTAPVKAKPFSWASLVRGPPAASSSTTPSKVPSPAKSTTSLPNNDNEAGPSTLPSTETFTPQSNDNVTSPPQAEKKKAPFNYAAAAAVGAAITPQEELAKLLSEGVKGKGKETTQATLPRGLINTGNMCFANTILQVLVYCSPFTELFEELGKRLKADLARKTPLLEAMIIFLREFNAPFPPPSAPLPNGTSTSGASTPKGKGKDPRREAFIPENVYDAMKENKRFDSMRRGHQEDAEEYLGFFLNTLHEELLYVLSRTQTQSSRSVSQQKPNGDSDQREISRPVSPGAGDESGWLEVGKKQKTHVVRATENKESAISRLFGGTIRSLLKTPGNKDSVTLEPYQPLQLDIQSNSVLSIEDALKHLTEPEIVPGVWSQIKKTQVDATKQIFIETFPQCWILHLKRFVYDPKEYNVVKKNKGVAYGQELVVPPEIISPGRRSAGAIKYKLFGVVYHHGATASGGHYTVAVSRQDGGGWIHFDDENVTNIPKEDVIVSKEESESGKIGLIGGREKTAYLLFYQRVR